MKFTKEQFEDFGKFYMDDLNINGADQDFMLKVFNLLPRHLQGLVVSWGFNDSVFRDDTFDYLIGKIYNLTVDQYYEREMYNFVNVDNDVVLEKLKS